MPGQAPDGRDRGRIEARRRGRAANRSSQQRAREVPQFGRFDGGSIEMPAPATTASRPCTTASRAHSSPVIVALTCCNRTPADG